MGSGEHRRWVSWQKTTPECSEDRHDSSAECGEDGKWALCTRTSVQAPHTHIWRTAKLSDKTHTYWIHLHLRANKTARSMSSLKTSSCIRYLIPSSPPLLRCVSTIISPLVLKFFLSHPLYRTTERIVGAWGKYKKWGPYYRLCEAGSGGFWGSFLSIHTVHTCQFLSSFSSFRSKSTTYGALVSGCAVVM